MHINNYHTKCVSVLYDLRRPTINKSNPINYRLIFLYEQKSMSLSDKYHSNFHRKMYNRQLIQCRHCLARPHVPQLRSIYTLVIFLILSPMNLTYRHCEFKSITSLGRDSSAVTTNHTLNTFKFKYSNASMKSENHYR